MLECLPVQKQERETEMAEAYVPQSQEGPELRTPYRCVHILPCYPSQPPSKGNRKARPESPRPNKNLQRERKRKDPVPDVNFLTRRKTSLQYIYAGQRQ